MKTLLLTAVFPPKAGGSGRWFWELYRRMPRDEVVIAAGEDPRQQEFDQTHDLHVVRLPLALPTWGTASLSGLAGYVRLWRQVGRLARRHGIERLHCGTLLPEGWVAWLLKRTRGLPYATYVHGEELNIGDGSRELGWMMARVLRGADAIIANSHNTSRLLQCGWQVPTERIRVLHPGVDVDQFRPAPADAEQRRRLGWHARPVVLTVGRLQARKGHDQLLRALPRIRQTAPDLLYVIVGDGPQRAALQDLVRAQQLQEHVQFRGEPTDAELLQCYQQCDLFVLPNREVEGDTEGFGMVLLEAQACGKPVVAGDSGGTAETMRTPETGWIISCDSVESLGEKVAQLLADVELRKRMGTAAREWVVEQFSWQPLAAEAQRLFGFRPESIAAESGELVCHK